MLLVVCQLSRDVIVVNGCEDCKRSILVLIDRSFVSQKSVGLLLIRLVALSIVCLSSKLVALVALVD